MPDIVSTGLLMVEYITSISLVLISLMIARGFVPILTRPDESPVWNLAAAVMSIQIGIAARALYWSAFPADWRAFLGKAPPNIIFGAILILGSYYLLRVLYLIIPDAERPHYNLFTAPFYPRRWREQLARALESLKRRD